MFSFIDLKCSSWNRRLISYYARKSKEKIDDMPQIEIEIKIEIVARCYWKKK